jgi:RNA polymerase sigma-70 factor (ECF subfamily)
MINVTEAELFKKCSKGDPKSQKQLFDIFSNRFFRMAVRYVKDSSEAEDVVMVAFVKIFDGLKNFRYQEPRSFESWMYRILVNESLMTLRRKHNFHLTETLELENPEHELEIFQDTDGEYLYQLILELPDGYRTVFNLYVIEGYDHQEIAGMLGINESTSRSQLFKAKQLLKRKIKQEGFHYGT